jgi:hypothetical protein
MDNINEFIDSVIRQDKKDHDGEYTDWLPFTDLELKGKTLQLVETRVLGIRGDDEHECVEIPVTQGIYKVQAKGVSFGNEKRIAGLRVFIDGATPARGNKVGEIPVDIGGVSVLDIDNVWESMCSLESEYEEWLEDLLFDDDYSLIKMHEWDETNTKIPTVEAGFGDGTYEVFELLDNGGVVGLEVEFITEGSKYPFDVE